MQSGHREPAVVGEQDLLALSAEGIERGNVERWFRVGHSGCYRWSRVRDNRRCKDHVVNQLRVHRRKLAPIGVLLNPPLHLKKGVA